MKEYKEAIRKIDENINELQSEQVSLEETLTTAEESAKVQSQVKDVRQEPAGSGGFPTHSTGTHRKHTGRWKQYSSRNFLGFFSMISDRFLQESTGNSQEFTGKDIRKLPAGKLLPFPVLSCGIR